MRYKIIEKNLRWTKQARECYERHCVCEGCILNDLENKCKMKQTVLKTYEKLGAPPPELEIDINEIYAYLDRGFYLKEIAEMYGMSANAFRKYTQAYGINGYKEKTRGVKKK